MKTIYNKENGRISSGSTNLMDKIFYALSKPIAVPFVMAIATYLSTLDRNYGYFFGLGIALVLLWKSGFNWRLFGYGKAFSIRTVIKSLIITCGVFIGIDCVIQPILEINLGYIDISSLDHIRGDFANYIILIIIMWVFAAFGEEFLFHGFYMKRLAELFGDTNKSWLISAIFISVYFGASHSYQGLAGMMAVGISSLVSALIFTKNRDNLALLILIHGFYDMIGITLIYLNKERVIVDWIESLL